MHEGIDSITLPNGGTAVKAIYSEQMLNEYRDNPLIEALPPILSKEDIIDRLSVFPYYEEKERELDEKYRFHCIQRLFQYFEPLNIHIDIEQRFSRVIRQGYLYRNPLGADYAMNLQQGYKRIKNGEYFLNRNQSFRTTASGFTIIGISGIGKTTTIERVLSMYPQIIVHSNYKDKHLSLYQIPWLKLDCPYDGSLKGLCISFFNAIDKLLGTDYYRKFGSTRNSVDTMLPRMAQIASLHCVGVLIIDEIQHLSLAKSGGADKMLNFFVTLVNTIGIPVILIGTTKAMSVLQGEFRQARRGSGQGDLVWDRMKNDLSWELLLNGMWELQWTKKVCPLTREVIDAMYEESQGIVDIAVKIYAMSQLKAIATGKEVISVNIIRLVAKDSLRLVRPMLDALRSGNLRDISKYGDITPIDIDAFYQEQLSKVELNKKLDAIKKQEENKKTTAKDIKEDCIFKLVQIGIQVTTAKNCVEKAMKLCGSNSTEEILMKEAFKISLELEESEKAKKQDEKAQINRETKNILKNVVDEGKNNKKTAYESLLAAGFTKNPVSEFIERNKDNVNIFPNTLSG